MTCRNNGLRVAEIDGSEQIYFPKIFSSTIILHVVMKLRYSIYYQRYDNFGLLKLFVEGFRRAKLCSAIFLLALYTLNQCDCLSCVLPADLPATDRRYNAIHARTGVLEGARSRVYLPPRHRENKNKLVECEALERL